MGLFKKLFGKKEKPVEVIKEVVEEVKVEPAKVDLPKSNVASLVSFAVSYNIPILVGNQNRINLLKDIEPDVECIGFAKNFTKHVTDTEFENGVLIDKTVDPELVEFLKENFPNIKIHDIGL
jgi:hypothetical protein